jgi:hypothetical protein
VTPEAGIEQAKYLLYHTVRLAPKNLPLKNSVQIFSKYVQSNLLKAEFLLLTLRNSNKYVLVYGMCRAVKLALLTRLISFGTFGADQEARTKCPTVPFTLNLKPRNQNLITTKDHLRVALKANPRVSLSSVLGSIEIVWGVISESRDYVIVSSHVSSP